MPKKIKSKPRFEKFLKPNDPLLRKISKKVSVADIGSPETKNDIKEMFFVARGEQGEKKTLVGLAAPQIGISKRILLVDVAANGKGKVGDLRLYINPEITWSSKKSGEWYEGCFSTDCVCGIVSRPDKVKIRAYDADGDIVKESYSGYVARIFQHEIDHLNGKEFITHIKDENKLHWVEKDEFPEYRNKEAWRNWSNKCPRSKWEKIKNSKHV